MAKDEVSEEHPTSIAGFKDMEELAEAIGNLRYDTLEEFFIHLANKFEQDHDADAEKDRPQLATVIYRASVFVDGVASEIAKAWNISENYMPTEEE